jgi:outer membrane protein OmpA-like peptidoglycan-associated protein
VSTRGAGLSSPAPNWADRNGPKLLCRALHPDGRSQRRLTLDHGHGLHLSSGRETSFGFDQYQLERQALDQVACWNEDDLIRSRQISSHCDAEGAASLANNLKALAFV